MTSVFYDVIHLESVRGDSNVPIWGPHDGRQHFGVQISYKPPEMSDGLWEIWTPKCCLPLYEPQKGTSLRHTACFGPLCQNPSTVTLVGKSGKKLKLKLKKTEALYSRISSDAPICTNFGLRVRLVDIINCAKFYRNRLRGPLLTIPIGLWYRR